jgi:branched-chain amino acid transport system substrate-binding protein
MKGFAVRHTNNIRRHVMKRVTIAIVLMGILFGGFSISLSAPHPETIKIGAVVSLTGPFGSAGVEVRNGYALGVDMINEAGGVQVKELGKKMPLELIVRDDESDPVKTVSRAEELCTRQNVTALLGGYGSSLHAAAIPVAERYKVPYLGVAFALYSIHQHGYKYLFSPYIKSPMQAKGMFDALQSELGDRRPKKFAIFEILDDWGRELSEYWRQEAKKHGSTIVYDVKHAMSTKDFSSLLLGAQAAGAEWLLASPNPADMMTMVKQMKELGINFKGVTATRPPRPNVWFKNMGDAGNYICVTPSSNPNLDYPGIDEVTRRYEAMTGVPRSLQSMSLDSVACIQIIADGIRRAGSLKGDKLRDAIAATNLMTPIGPISFNPDGSGKMRFVLTQFQNFTLELILPKHARAKPLVYPMPTWDKRPK